MREKPWLDLCQNVSDALDRLVGTPEGVPADPVSLADAVQLFVAQAHLLDRGYDRLWEHAGRGRLEDAIAVGHRVTSILEAVTARGRQLLQTGDDPGGRGARALARLDDMLKVHRVGWAWDPIPTREEAIAAHDRGESLGLDDAFAQIAGISREELLRRVEAVKLQRRASAG